MLYPQQSRKLADQEDTGQWHGKSTLGHDPTGKVLGILGMGGIGRVGCKLHLTQHMTRYPNIPQQFAHRARAFGMKIQYHNRSRLPSEQEGDATYVPFEELLATSDILSLNLSLNESTRHIIGTPEFQKMKAGVIVINTARGALIDEKALVAAIESGKV